MPTSRKSRAGIQSIVRWAAALAVLLLVSPARAATNSWTSIGPYDVNIPYGAPFAVAPSSPSTIYTAVEGASVMKTTDGGRHWVLRDTPAPFSLLAVDPIVPDTIYALGGPVQGVATFIYKSVDGGETWGRGFTAGRFSTIEQLAIAPSRSSTVYVTQSGVGIFKSIDGGSSWTAINDGLSGFFARALAIDPMDPDTAYVALGDEDPRIFKLSHGTNQWRRLPVPLPVDAIVTALAVDPVTPSVIYAAYAVFAPNDELLQAGVFKSVDAGETWAAVPNPPADANGTRLIAALAIDPRAPRRIYAAANYGVYLSTDAGASWVPINAGLFDLFVWDLAIDATGSIVRTATRSGLFEYLASPAMPHVQTAIEYGFRSVWDYDYSSYFVTSSPDEIAALDRGAFNDRSGLIWERTGESFNVWSGPENGALPTCRFFNATLGVEHFYTPYAAECAIVRATDAWRYEGTAFYLELPDEAGHCPGDTTVLYRLYWAGTGGPAHRLTTKRSTFDAMRAAGWIFEGNATTGAFACAASTTTG